MILTSVLALVNRRRTHNNRVITQTVFITQLSESAYIDKGETT